MRGCGLHTSLYCTPELKGFVAVIIVEVVDGFLWKVITEVMIKGKFRPGAFLSFDKLVHCWQLEWYS